ncbi:fibronectin type III domain-containing protein, partial [Flavobacteriaceae bacterium KMM 6897]|nr:fibronectin type III domain-containing protein [Flavobacteriaceae bacterium KMM 6897]
MILKILYKFLSFVGYEKHLKTLFFVGSLFIFGFSGYGQDTEPPTEPGLLEASNVTSTTVDLSWTFSTDNEAVTDYRVYNSGVLLVASTGGTGTTYTVLGLTPSTPYSLTVRAIDAANNESGDSNIVNVTTTADVTPPSAPTGLAASGTTATTTTLNWTASTDNVAVTGYRVFQGGSLIGTTGGATTTFNVTLLSPSTAYAFTVRAIDAVPNESADSNIANVTTTADVTPPSAPTGLAASGTTATTTTLNWTASTDNVAVTGYRVFQGGSLIGTT